MVVITRRVGESIRIGDGVAVRVLEIVRGAGRQEVRFAIDAPHDVPVDREETRRKKQHDKEEP